MFYVFDLNDIPAHVYETLSLVLVLRVVNNELRHEVADERVASQSTDVWPDDGIDLADESLYERVHPASLEHHQQQQQIKV